MFESDRNLYLNADKSQVLEEGDPNIAYLLVGAGCQISLAEAEAYGLVKPRVQGPTHEVHSNYSGIVHAPNPDAVRMVSMGIRTSSPAGTPEGGDDYPSKHPFLNREDFDESHDEDAIMNDADAALLDQAKEADKESAAADRKLTERVNRNDQAAESTAESAGADASASGPASGPSDNANADAEANKSKSSKK